MITMRAPTIRRDEGLASKVLTLEDIKLREGLTHENVHTYPTSVAPPSDREISTFVSPPHSEAVLPFLDVPVCQELSCSSPLPTSTPLPAPLSPPKYLSTCSKHPSHKRNTISSWSRAAAIEIKRNLMHSSLGMPHSTPLILFEFLARTHIEQLPERYMGSLNDVGELITHMILMHQVEVHGDYRVSVRSLPNTTVTTSPRMSPQCMEITICCVDKPKVAALLTRVLDGSVRDVIDADIMTSKRNLVRIRLSTLIM